MGHTIGAGWSKNVSLHAGEAENQATAYSGLPQHSQCGAARPDGSLRAVGLQLTLEGQRCCRQTLVEDAEGASAVVQPHSLRRGGQATLIFLPSFLAALQKVSSTLGPHFFLEMAARAAWR